MALPDGTNQFAAHVFLSGAFVRHHPFGCGTVAPVFIPDQFGRNGHRRLAEDSGRDPLLYRTLDVPLHHQMKDKKYDHKQKKLIDKRLDKFTFSILLVNRKIQNSWCLDN